MINKSEKQIMEKWGDYSIPLVTIRCTAYNQEKYIEKTLDGFLLQETNFPFEILVHDDASTDRTPRIIKEYSKKFPQIIRSICETENQYSKGNHTLGRIMNEKCRGKYCAICEGDDYWTSPYKLQKQISYMEENPNCLMTFHAVLYECNGKIVKNDRRFSKECDVAVSDIIEGGGYFCATPSLCVRTKEMLQFPKYRSIALVGDYPLQVMMATKGEVHYFPDIMGVYRVSSVGSWTERMQSSKNIEKYARNGIEWLEEFNRDSKRKFSDSVNEKIIDYKVILYKISNSERFTQLFFEILKLKKKKMFYSSQILKIFIYKHFPFVIKIYHIIKGKVLNERT